jgi:murein tripeptide amidase MpaA
MEISWIFVLCFALTVLTVSAEKVKYDNYRVYSLAVENEQQLAIMKEIENNPDGYRFWEFPTAVGHNVDIVVPPHKIVEFQDMVLDNQMKSKLMVPDLQKLIDEEQPAHAKRASFGWTQYHSLEEIYAFLTTMANQYSSIATIQKGGTTYEGREINGIKIEFAKGLPSVVIEANIHAREWITSATATYLINYILTAQDRGVFAQYNWYIFPVLNPDGFVYSKNRDRLWRKTRSRNGLCYGADPNRNWGYNWNQGGASTSSCSDLFAGPSAFSEIETRTFSEYLKTVPNLAIYLDFHSYSQLLMVPYGHTSQRLDNYYEAIDIANKAVTSLSKLYGTKYNTGNIVEAIYVSSGGSIDWVKAVLKARLSYAFEFRDTGKYGFVLPPDQIIPNSLEVIEGIRTILTEYKKLN